MLPTPLSARRTSGQRSLFADRWTRTRRMLNAMGINRRMIASITAAMTYGGVSIALTLLNKALFATYQFSQTRILGLGQFITALFMLRLFKHLKLIDIPNIQLSVAMQIWPLSASYLVMVVCGFAAMKATNIVMFGTLRRTGIVLVLILEYNLLGRRPSRLVILSTIIMVIGVVTAGAADLSYDPTGYVYAIITNLATAIHIVLISHYKNTLKLNAFGMLNYNALLSTPPLFLLSFVNNDFTEMLTFENINVTGFWVVFSISCILGFVINWSVFFNTSVNSPLTQTVTGQLKDILVLLFGVAMFDDVPFSRLNAFGVTLSLFGSIIYASVKYQEMQNPPPKNYDPVDTVEMGHDNELKEEQ